MSVFDRFHEDFIKQWNRYIELDKELIQYRGVEITNENIEDINRIVVGLQDCYAQMHSALSFVSSWSINVATLIKEHSKFMDDIKAAGGIPDKVVETKEKEAEA